MMIKKLSIIAVAGVSIFLAGCSLPGDEQVAQQTVILANMQQQMVDLLSGMNALHAENEKLTVVLDQMQEYIDKENKVAEALQDATHGSASLFDSGMDVIFNYSGDTKPLTGLDIPLPEIVAQATGEKTAVVTWEIATEAKVTPNKQNSGSILNELRKANAMAKSWSKDQSTWAKIATGTSESSGLLIK